MKNNEDVGFVEYFVLLLILVAGFFLKTNGLELEYKITQNGEVILSGNNLSESGL